MSLIPIKVWLGLALGLVLFVGGWWLHDHLIALGDAKGAARVQALWDKDRAQIAALTAQAAADNAKQAAEAAANNGRIISALQTQLSAASAGQSALAQRLRDAEARTAARGSALPGPPGQPPAPLASTAPSASGLAEICAALDTEDQHNADQLDALIAQIRGQVKSAGP